MFTPKWWAYMASWFVPFVVLDFWTRLATPLDASITFGAPVLVGASWVVVDRIRN